MYNINTALLLPLPFSNFSLSFFPLFLSLAKDKEKSWNEMKMLALKCRDRHLTKLFCVKSSEKKKLVRFVINAHALIHTTALR
jgi:hypothetical protein